MNSPRLDLDVFLFQSPTLPVIRQLRENSELELLISGSFAVDCVCSLACKYKFAQLTEGKCLPRGVSSLLLCVHARFQNILSECQMLSANCGKSVCYASSMRTVPLTCMQGSGRLTASSFVWRPRAADGSIGRDASKTARHRKAQTIERVFTASLGKTTGASEWSSESRYCFVPCSGVRAILVAGLQIIPKPGSSLQHAEDLVHQGWHICWHAAEHLHF